MAYKKLKYWFDEKLMNLLSTKILEVEPNFDIKEFLKNSAVELESLELKDRVEFIADRLFSCLSESYEKNIDILVKILGPENENEKGMFLEYYWVMPIAKYVEKYGLNEFDTSMHAIEEITKRNTGEYSIRPFIENHFDKTMEQILHWSLNKNKHVRRLASEGVRPRLPWAKKLDCFIKNPEQLIPILENLKDDKSRYVQKSVANCINDILKDNYEIGKSIIEMWCCQNTTPERQWIIEHALRNRIKVKDNWAITILKLIASKQEKSEKLKGGFS